MFRDRAEAADQLAQALAHHRGHDPLVLAVPRGGVPMGRIIADALGGELDIVLVRKIGAPGNPEYAIGAIGEDGTVDLRDDLVAHADEDWLEREAQRQLEALQARRRRYLPVQPPMDPAGRVVIVVDDGAATGATLTSALRIVRAREPAHLAVALGVAPPESVARLRDVADEVVCLDTPRAFHAVGQFYRNFRQVDDDEVIALLAAGR